MKEDSLMAAAEAVLFASGDPLSLRRIARALEVEPQEAASVLENLADSLDERNSGICLKKLGEQYQLCTRQEYSDAIHSVLEMKKNTPLSNAAFEVLAVVAYNQPVTKAFIEQVRGVDCSGVVASLAGKGLIEEKGRLDLPGRPIVYGTTPAFLRCFCIESLDELPPLPNTEAEEADDADDV